MSQENVEIIRKAYEAFARGDGGAILNILHPEVEIHDHDAPDRPSPYHGHEGWVRFVGEELEVWDDLRFEPEDLIESGDQAVVLIRQTARGKGSGVPIEGRDFHVWTFRDGKVVRLDAYADKAEALEAVGLQE